MDDSPGRRARRWLLIVVLLSAAPVFRLFTLHRIFFIRDLSFFFWSRHLWFRHTVFSGQLPWWDPYVAAGQSAIADALNQLVMPLTLVVRLLPSDVVSFNLWVALPLPVAAAGMFVFLRRHLASKTAPEAAAALGACAFVLAGPIVSMLNSPNLAWSVALMPWVIAAAEPIDSGSSLLAVAFALQALCGEPVTWAATGVLALAFRPRLGTLFGLAGGGLLAAAQQVPTLAAGVRAHRAALATPDFWSLHPLSLWETVAPHLFGNYYDAFLGDLPWMGALNFGRDPFFYSLYVGPFVLLLAAIAIAERPLRSAFWLAILAVFTAAALGGYTPFYPLLRRILPPLMYFRFPVKYIVVAVFAAAVLAAEGWDAIVAGVPHRKYGVPALAGIAGAAGLLVATYTLLAPDVTVRASRALAIATRLKDTAAGAEFLARVAPPLAIRAFALLLAGSILAGLAARRRALAGLLFAAVCVDLLVTNGGLNLTIEVSKLTPPAWFTAAAGEQRLYIGGRVRGYMNGNDPDAVSTWQIPAEATAVEGRMELNAQLPMAPSGWGTREALSYDLPYLWPAQYEATVRRFEQAGPRERDAFLRRSGVRWCVLPRLGRAYREQSVWRTVADVDDWNMRVYDCHPYASRAIIAGAVSVAARPADEAWQRDGLFDPAAADDAVRVAAMPAPAGRPGAPVASPRPPGHSSVRILKDAATEVSLDAVVARPALLVLRDTYDPGWTATIDGLPAEVARADGMYRAVALPAGHHVVDFVYRPRDFYLGLTITVATLLVGAFGVLFSRFGVRGSRFGDGGSRFGVRGSRFGDRQSGFTLIELMIVLAIIAILLTVAFNEYRGMQARGNEASALSSMRTIAVAQWQFALTCARGKYAVTLEALAQAVPQTGHAFLSPDLAMPNGFEKSGYRLQMTAKPIDDAPPACNGAAVAESYAATADPVKPGVTGARFYGVNADRVIFADDRKTFTGDMPETGAPPHGQEIK